MSAEMAVWLRNCLCLYSRCECHTYGCLPSHRASPPPDWCQIILLGDRGTCAWTTCPRLLTDSGMAWTSELRDHRCDHYIARPHPVAYCRIYILLLYYCEPSHVTFGIMSNSTGCGSNCKEYLRPVVFWSMTYYTSLTARQEMMGFWDALTSAGPYANNLHLAPDGYPRQHLITQFLQARCSSRCPVNSVKALMATELWHTSRLSTSEHFTEKCRKPIK